MVLNVFRWSPGARERLQKYWVKARQGMTVLDALVELQRSSDATLAFRYACRVGMCGSCGMVINGVPHGPAKSTTACQLHMRSFNDGDEITIEPWRAAAFPVLRDLVVDRSALDRVIQAGGYISVRAGAAPEANSLPVPKLNSDTAFEAAACIGCGACVAACPNASAALFTAAKITHLALLPQGGPERADRVRKMVAQMDAEGFGHCSSHKECEAACPKDISISFIAKMNRELLAAMATAPNEVKSRSKG